MNQDGRNLQTELSIAVDMPLALRTHHNLPRKLSLIRSKLCVFLKSFKRTPATHMFVFMISSALRNRKPYALPIQCLAYAGMKEQDMRRLVSAIVKEMVIAGMKVAGMLRGYLVIV